MTNIAHPSAAQFRDAETVAEFDDLAQAAGEHFAAQFETDEEYEAAGGDSAADSALESFLQSVGLEHRRGELLAAD